MKTTELKTLIKEAVVNGVIVEKLQILENKYGLRYRASELLIEMNLKIELKNLIGTYKFREK